MNLLHTETSLSKEKIVKRYKLTKYLRNSIYSLKADKFKCFKTKNYLENIKFSIVTIIYNSNNDDLFFKNIDCFLNQDLDNIELIIINNGAKDNLLKRLNDILINKKNITIVLNPIPQFEIDIARLYDPVISLANLGLLISKGLLFSWVSWDDEISFNYCSSIYKKYIQTGCKALAPIQRAIDIESRILKERSYDLAKSFKIKGNTIPSIEIIKSRIHSHEKDIFSSPGELLSFERNFLILRGGIDFDIDCSQYLITAVGINIALVKNASLYWRYHENQAHLIHASYFNKSHIKRIKDLYKVVNIYQIYSDNYGLGLAEEIKNYYLKNKIIDVVTRKIIFLKLNKILYPIRLFKEISSELNLNLILIILFKLLRFYLYKFLNLFIIILKNPKKLIKIKKYLK